MNLSVIEPGDQICINISEKILWILKEKKPEVGTHPPVPEIPTEGSGCYKSVQYFLRDLQGEKAEDMAMRLVYLVAWTAGLVIVDNTEKYLQKKPWKTFVFEMLKAKSYTS